MNSETDTGPELVWGARQIAAVIRRNERQTYYLLETGRIPARKIGDQWVGDRAKILAAIVGEGA